MPITANDAPDMIQGAARPKGDETEELPSICGPVKDALFRPQEDTSKLSDGARGVVEILGEALNAFGMLCSKLRNNADPGDSVGPRVDAAFLMVPGDTLYHYRSLILARELLSIAPSVKVKILLHPPHIARLRLRSPHMSDTEVVDNFLRTLATVFAANGSQKLVERVKILPFFADGGLTEEYIEVPPEALNLINSMESVEALLAGVDEVLKEIYGTGTGAGKGDKGRASLLKAMDIGVIDDVLALASILYWQKIIGTDASYMLFFDIPSDIVLLILMAVKRICNDCHGKDCIERLRKEDCIEKLREFMFETLGLIPVPLKYYFTKTSLRSRLPLLRPALYTSTNIADELKRLIERRLLLGNSEGFCEKLCKRASEEVYNGEQYALGCVLCTDPDDLLELMYYVAERLKLPNSSSIAKLKEQRANNQGTGSNATDLAHWLDIINEVNALFANLHKALNQRETVALLSSLQLHNPYVVKRVVIDKVDPSSPDGYPLVLLRDSRVLATLLYHTLCPGMTTGRQPIADIRMVLETLFKNPRGAGHTVGKNPTISTQKYYDTIALLEEKGLLLRHASGYYPARWVLVLDLQKVIIDKNNRTISNNGECQARLLDAFRKIGVILNMPIR